MTLEVERAFFETVAWVQSRLPSEDLGSALRTESLRPSDFPPLNVPDDPYRWGAIDRMLESPERAAAAVKHIVEERRAALARLGISVSMKTPGGRILCTDFNSDVCGAATEPSLGLLDWEDVPPWDTWFHHARVGPFSGIVACWIPDELVDTVQRGIDVIPVLCLWWDDEAPKDVGRLFPRLGRGIIAS